MFKIYNQRLAGYLMQKGFRLMALEKNRLNEHYSVFCFEKSDALADAIAEYKKIKN